MATVAANQPSGVLRVHLQLGTVGRPGGGQQRHVLLVSDDPPSRVPWRVIIGVDGRGRVTLPPGTYTVESDEPLVTQGKAFEWRQTVAVAAGADTLLDLTPENAEIREAAALLPHTDANTGRMDPWDVLLKWESSVVSLWTPTAHAAGALIADTGLIATNQRVIGTATTIGVQLGPETRVAAHVLVADAPRDIAILWADPAALASRTPVPTGCTGDARPAVSPGQALTALGTRPGGVPYPVPGTVMRVEPGHLRTDLGVTADGTGGPVFANGDVLVGLTTAPADAEDANVVAAGALCEVLAAAREKTAGSVPPARTPLRVEPTRRAPEEALAAMATRRAGSLLPYRIASSDFDIAFITPVMAYAARQGAMDFGNWSTYVSSVPPVLLVRVTPRQVERFWTTVARGAAMTQGVALPAFTHFKPGFLRMRVTCGGVEVAPIHPLLIERRISETDAVREGLYVFAPDDLGPQCGRVTLEIASEKTPDRRDTVVVESSVVEQIARDFAEYEKVIE